MSANCKAFLGGRMQGMAHDHRRDALLGAMDRLPPSRPARWLRRGADMAGVVTVTPPDAQDPVSTVAEQIIAGEPFQIDKDEIYQVDRVLFSAHGPQADLLVLKGRETIGGETHDVCRAIQVRDLEAMLAQYRIKFPFDPSSSEWSAITAPVSNDDTIDHLN